MSDVPDFIGLGRSGRGDLSERAMELRRAGFDQQTVLEWADELATRFEEHDPNLADIKDAYALRAVRWGAHACAEAERRLAGQVSVARAEGHSWAAIGAMLGTSGETARERYG